MLFLEGPQALDPFVKLEIGRLFRHGKDKSQIMETLDSCCRQDGRSPALAIVFGRPQPTIHVLDRNHPLGQLVVERLGDAGVDKG